MRFAIPIYCRYSDKILRMKLIHDRENPRRSNRLRDFGEQLAIKLLTAAGFTAILDLNEKQPNYPFADLYADRHEDAIAAWLTIPNKNRSENALDCFCRVIAFAMPQRMKPEK